MYRSLGASRTLPMGTLKSTLKMIERELLIDFESCPCCSSNALGLYWMDTGDHLGQLSAIFLPMIYMDPGDLTSSLFMITQLATRSQQFVTFDLPLWWKVMIIIESEAPGSSLKSIVLQFGGIHVLIGHLMSGSGLEEILELVYTPNTVPKMLFFGHLKSFPS